MSLLKSVEAPGFKAVDGACAWARWQRERLRFISVARSTATTSTRGIRTIIRRVLPAWRAIMGTYFRGESRGLDNIPTRDRRCSWETTRAAR